MNELFDHQKRPTVPNTLHGTINQIAKAMFHAFVNAYTSDSDFYIVTEDTGFGDFDDLVLITSERKITAIQYKHNKSGTETISFNDVITSSGSGKELMFHKYYLSMLNLKLEWENDPQLTLELASNSPIDQTLSRCIDPDTKQFTQAFFVEDTCFEALIRRIIIASILKHNRKLNVANPTIMEPYLNHVDLILPNHTTSTNLLNKLFKIFKKRGQKCQTDQEKIAVITAAIQELRKSQQADNVVLEKLIKLFNENVLPHSGITHIDVITANECLEKNTVIKFLEKLKFSYSEPSKDQTILSIKNMLSEQFSLGKDATEILYNTFFYNFMEWLGQEKAIHITNVDIKNRFTEWKNRFLQLQQWIGISDAYQKNLVITIDGKEFKRDDLVDKLIDFQESEKRALVLHGDRGIGKSTFICQYFLRIKKLDSDCLMLDINTILRSLSSIELTNHCSFDFFHACQIIAIENCEDLIKYSTETIKAFENLISRSPKNIKFIFSMKDYNFNAENKLFNISHDLVDTIKIPKLDKKAINTIFPFIYTLPSSSTQLTLYQKTQPNVLLENIVCHPFYLNLLVMYYKKNGSFAVNFSSKDDFVKEILESLLTKSQLSIVRHLIFSISQGKKTTVLATTHKIDLDNLILQSIVVEENGNYQFSHKLYEEWALRAAVEMRLTCMIEANEDIIFVYQEMMRLLPTSQKELFIYLGENDALREYRRSLSTISNNQKFIENNNVCFLKNSIENTNYIFFQDTTILYVLVDTDPEGLLNLLLDMVNIIKLDVWQHISTFRDDFYQVLIRGFCIAKNMISCGKLFYQILKKLEDSCIQTCFDTSFFMGHFFENTFAASQSPGLMPLQEKIRFLEVNCNSTNLSLTEDEMCYWQYIYQGLLIAANPQKPDDIFHHQLKNYFSDGCSYINNIDGYMNYKGEYFGFSPHKREIRANYHCQAVRILLKLYKCTKNLSSSALDSRDILRDIEKIFEATLANAVIDIETGFLNIIDVASIIAAEISLDDDLFRKLENYLANKCKHIDILHKSTATDKDFAFNGTFEPEQSYRLQKMHLTQIQEILQWRKENQYQIYELKEIPTLLSEASAVTTLEIGQNSKMFQ